MNPIKCALRILCIGLSSLLLCQTTSAASVAQSMRHFKRTVNQIAAHSITHLTQQEIIQLATQSVANAIDPYSTYLNAEQLKSANIMKSGQYAGIGIVIRLHHRAPRVAKVMKNSPAEHAGLTVGDYIVKLNSQPVDQLTLDQLVSTIRGKADTQVQLTIQHGNTTKTLSLTRKIIKTSPILEKQINAEMGYIKILRFDHTLPGAIKKAVTSFKQSIPSLSGLIIDLRNNPGGLLSASVKTVDLFADPAQLKAFRGVVVTLKARDDATTQETIQGHDLIPHVPIVIIINHASASASEIVTGALQDYHRAIVIGQRSFGKGSVQTILPIGQGTAIKLTTAYYLTPAGRQLQSRGIVPDIILPRLKETWWQSSPKKETKVPPNHSHDSRLSLPPAIDQETQQSNPLHHDYAVSNAEVILKTLAMKQTTRLSLHRALKAEAGHMRRQR